MKNSKQFVILEHLCLPDRGFRFFSTNSNNNTHSAKGELWYKEVGFADTVEEAQSMLSPNTEVIPSFQELFLYHTQQAKLRNS